MSWLEKYRPVTFDDFWQDCPALTFTRKAVQAGRVPSVLLAIAEYGDGKTSLSRVLGRRFSCENAAAHAYNPCGHCRQCQSIRPVEGRTMYRDGYVEFDATQFEPRELAKLIQHSTWGHKWGPRDPHPEWVVCLDEIARVKPDFQNMLLKAVEGVPDAVFIMCFSDPSVVNAALRERSVYLHLPRPTTEECAAGVARIAKAEQWIIDDVVARFLVESVNRIPRRCILALEQATLLSPGRQVTFEAAKVAVEMVAK